MNTRNSINTEILRSVFSYDRDTGLLLWRHNRGKNKTAGIAAGTKRADGYILVRLGGKNYLAHRIAWALTHGEWPELLDHIDGNPSNNAIANLRVATHSQNKANKGKNANNTSGFKGVTFSRQKRNRKKPWKAMIKINGVTNNLGMFATPEQAHAAYAAAAGRLFGEFARAA